MDTKPCLYDIGWCFSFTLKSDDIRSLVIEFKKELFEKKASALLISDIFDLPFGSGIVTVFLYHTYSRRAYDLYYKFNGKDIRSIDPVALQCILSGLGKRSARRPDFTCLGYTTDPEYISG